MASWFVFRSLRCFPLTHEPGTWAYVPVAADLQRDDIGRPMLTLADLGSTAYLLFTASWSADEADLKALRTEIASRKGSLDEASIRLVFAPISSLTCHALLGDGEGAYETVATSETSGYPPYHAVFNLFLEGERLGRAKTSLSGRPGFLAVDFQANISVPVRGQGTFTAPADLFDWIRDRGAVAEKNLADLLEEAVRENRARILVDVPDSYAGDITPALYGRILTTAAAAVGRKLNRGPPGAISITLTLDQSVDESIHAYADLGTIVAVAGNQALLLGGRDAAD